MATIIELLNDRDVIHFIAFLIVILLGLIWISMDVKSGKAMKKFIEEEEEYKRWRDTIDDVEKPFYKK